MNAAVRALASLTLALAGAFALSLVIDLLVGVMLRDYPRTVFHPIAVWSVVTVVAFPTALAARGPPWTIWVPCAVVAGMATRVAWTASTSHKWVVACVLLGQALFTWWAMRPQSPRLQPSEPE